MVFKCRECKLPKDDSEAKKGSITDIRTGHCKLCHSTAVNRKVIEKRFAAHPHRYYECDYCDQIWSRSFGNICIKCGEVGLDKGRKIIRSIRLILKCFDRLARKNKEDKNYWLTLAKVEMEELRKFLDMK